MINWQDFALSGYHAVSDKTIAIATTFGLGGGVGIVKFLAHCPAPKHDHVWKGSMFDTLQDLVSNKTRIGERRGPAGETVFIVKPDAPKQ